MAPPATLTDLFPEQPANHASSHGRRARAVRSLFFGKERAPSESVLGVRAVPLFAENPRRGVLGNPYSSTRIPIRYRDVWWRYVCSASFREEFFSETAELVKLEVWGRTGFDVSGQRPVRRAEFAGDSLNAGN